MGPKYWLMNMTVAFVFGHPTAVMGPFANIVKFFTGDPGSSTLMMAPGKTSFVQMQQCVFAAWKDSMSMPGGGTTKLPT